MIFSPRPNTPIKPMKLDSMLHKYHRVFDTLVMQFGMSDVTSQVNATEWVSDGLENSHDCVRMILEG